MLCLFRFETTPSAGHVTRFAYCSNERDGDPPACVGSKPSLQVINQTLASTLIHVWEIGIKSSNIKVHLYIFCFYYTNIIYICIHACTNPIYHNCHMYVCTHMYICMYILYTSIPNGSRFGKVSLAQQNVATSRSPWGSRLGGVVWRPTFAPPSAVGQTWRSKPLADIPVYCLVNRDSGIPITVYFYPKNLQPKPIGPIMYDIF